MTLGNVRHCLLYLPRELQHQIAVIICNNDILWRMFTLSVVLTFAPWASRASTMSVWPLPAAHVRQDTKNWNHRPYNII